MIRVSSRLVLDHTFREESSLFSVAKSCIKPLLNVCKALISVGPCIFGSRVAQIHEFAFVDPFIEHTNFVTVWFRGGAFPLIAASNVIPVTRYKPQLVGVVAMSSKSFQTISLFLGLGLA